MSYRDTLGSTAFAAARSERARADETRAATPRVLLTDIALATAHLGDLGPGADPMIGRVIGERYRLLRRLGSGGMGRVYEAEHVVIGRRLAVKVMHPQLAADADVVGRFLNEARAAAMLRHPSILAACDIGRLDDSTPYVVLELLSGHSLAVELAGQRISIARATRIVGEVSSGLAVAHDKGIVHRDLKPENVFLAVDELDRVRAKVLDFGISKFSVGSALGRRTGSGVVMGTPFYMAPEQMDDASTVGPEADIYALGVMLFEMLSGDVPFHADTFPALVALVLEQDAPALQTLRADLPDDLADLVKQCLEKNPRRRPRSMREVEARVAPFASAELTIDAEPSQRPPVPPK